jgi:hypothetical protein
MVRSYDVSRPVPAEVHDRIVGNSLRAPSAGFSQGWGFLVLDTPTDVARFREAVRPPDHPEDWLAANMDAPLLIIRHSDKDAYLDRYAQPDTGFPDRSDAWWPAPYWDIDTGFASLLMLLTAVDAGLGACFFRHPHRADQCLPGSVRCAGPIHPDRGDLHRPQRRATTPPEQPPQGRVRDGPPRPLEPARHMNPHRQPNFSPMLLIIKSRTLMPRFALMRCRDGQSGLSRAGRRGDDKPGPRSEMNADLFRAHVPSSRRPTHSHGGQGHSTPRGAHHSTSRPPERLHVW